MMGAALEVESQFTERPAIGKTHERSATKNLELVWISLATFET